MSGVRAKWPSGYVVLGAKEFDDVEKFIFFIVEYDFGCFVN